MNTRRKILLETQIRGGWYYEYDFNITFEEMVENDGIIYGDFVNLFNFIHNMLNKLGQYNNQGDKVLYIIPSECNIILNGYKMDAISSDKYIDNYITLYFNSESDDFGEITLHRDMYSIDCYPIRNDNTLPTESISFSFPLYLNFTQQYDEDNMEYLLIREPDDLGIALLEYINSFPVKNTGDRRVSTEELNSNPIYFNGHKVTAMALTMMGGVLEIEDYFIQEDECIWDFYISPQGQIEICLWV